MSERKTDKSDPEGLGGADTALGLVSEEAATLHSVKSTPQSPHKEVARGTALGRYVVLGRLGAGGMGTVYAAYDPELDRKIALKLLTGGFGGSSSSTAGRARLQREAQAMARLSHPNVVSVYDVGHIGDAVFIAMEFIAGQTLKDWLAERSPPTRQERTEIIDTFIRAGRGLAAAHRADVVHRDFKPENVMIGQDGRVMVLDFGLAHEARGGRTKKTEDDGPDASHLSIRLTQTGSVMGTPVYMSPEQHRGDRTDARTDQFSFCVALYEALYGERPFAGKTIPQLAASVTSGELKTAPSSIRLPLRLRRLLRRGLSKDPDDRFESMVELLDVLEHDPAKARRRYIIAGIAAAVLVGGTFAATRAAGPDEACPGFEESLGQVWGDDQRSAIEEAFAAVGSEHAADTFGRVDTTLTEYGDKWVAAHQEACEAARIRHEQPPDVYALQERCYEHARGRIAAVVELLSSADEQVVTRAMQAASTLPPLAACDDTDELSHGVEPPDSAEVHEAVDELRARFEDIRLLSLMGKVEEAGALTQTVEEDARATGYAPVIAEALVAKGWYTSNFGKAQDAERLFAEAVLTAERAGYDLEIIDGLAGLMRAVVAASEDFDRAERIAARAIAVAERADKPAARAAVLAQLGAVRINARKADEALEVLEESLAFRRSEDKPDASRIVFLLQKISAVHRVKGDYDQAAVPLQEAIEILESDEAHSEIQMNELLFGLAALRSQQGRPGEALEHMNKAIEGFLRVLGPNHVNVGAAHYNTHLVYEAIRMDEESLVAVDLSVAAFERALPSGHPNVAKARYTRGQLHMWAGRFDEALVDLEKAATIYAAAQPPKAAFPYADIALVQLRTGDASSALASAEQAIKYAEPEGDERIEAATVARARRGWALRELGRTDEAIEALEAAIPKLLETDAPPRFVGRAWLDLGLALRQAKRERDRADALIRNASALLGATYHGGPDLEAALRAG